MEIFKIKILKLAENEFYTTKIPDFWNFVACSMTFRDLFQVPRLFQVFQVSSHSAFYQQKLYAVVRKSIQKLDQKTSFLEK